MQNENCQHFLPTQNESFLSEHENRVEIDRLSQKRKSEKTKKEGERGRKNKLHFSRFDVRIRHFYLDAVTVRMKA